MNRKLTFVSTGWDDYTYWQKYDKKVLKKINTLIKEILRTPEEGAGKPETLKNEYSGYWSRRINQKDRLIYGFSDSEVVIIACRYHYDD